MKAKKLISLFLCTVMVLASCVFTYAAEPVGSLNITKTVTYINHYPIPSYEFNGNMYICVDFLNCYGFEFIQNDYEKSKCIVRSSSNSIMPIPAYISTDSQVDTEFEKLYTCETKVYLGDHAKPVDCYKDTDGYLYIKANELGYFGKADYVADVDALKIWISDGLDMRETMVPLRPNPFPTCYHKGMRNGDLLNRKATVNNKNVSLAIGIYDNDGNYIITNGYAEITILNSDGKSICSVNKYFSENDFSVTPYAYFYTACHLSVLLNTNRSQVTPTSDGKGLLKAKIHVDGLLYSYEQYIEGLPTIQ